ncbi:MAG: hypothetical protein ISS01_02725 [Nanoarchaeota archaeon]|nr:hypothetical protein [Nanoarchaeota archaeon]
MSLLEQIKDKKEFRKLSEDLISRVLVKVSEKYDVTDKKDQKKIVKETRARLRDLYSAFRMRNFSKKEKYLEEMKDWEDKEICKKILQVHLSTRERAEYYDDVYMKIRKYVDFKSVLDLGCGLNVFSMPWMGRVDYYGIDVNQEDVDFCNSYLEKFGLRGAIRWGDVLSFDNHLKSEVCFMFKVLEGFESLERGFTEKLFEKISSPYIVASFATRSLGGGKSISEKRLKWFEKIVEGKVLEKFKLADEVYFIVKR